MTVATESAPSITLLDVPTERPTALPATMHQAAPVARPAAQQHLPQQTETARLIAAIAEAARDPQVDIEKMERLMQMHERMRDHAALTVFNDRMSVAQAEMAPVSADAENPQTKSRYASYAQLDRALRPIYTKYGFSVSFDTGDGAPADYLRVLAYVSCAGYTRTYHYDMPCDGKGAKGGDVMTKTHAAGSAGSYGMRYLLKMIFNVAVGENDDDGNGASGTETAEQREAKDPTLKAGWDAADKGMVTLTKWWGSLNAKQQKTYSPDFGQMRKNARDVDQGAGRG